MDTLKETEKLDRPKTTSKLVSLYVLKQVKNLKQDMLLDYLTHGYTLEEFVETKSTAEDRAIPQEEFAKTVYKNLISTMITKSNTNIRSIKNNFETLLFEYGDWVKSISENGNKAYDIEIHIIVVDKFIRHEICTEYIRVEVRDITDEREDIKCQDAYTEDKRNMAKLFIEKHPEWSNRSIGRECRIDRRTISKYRKELDNTECEDND